MNVEKINYSRIETIAELFCKLGFKNIVKFDVHEPEYIALKEIYDRGVKPEYLGLIAICTGVIDFQLGSGGAETLWLSLSQIVKDFKLDNLKQIEILMKVFLNEPINARSLSIKISRIRKIFSSGFAEWYLNNYEYLRKNPIFLWKKLAETLGSSMEKKTMVFAMKAFEISNLVCYGEYLDFPWDIPIPVDFHVKHVTISAGLLPNYGSDDLIRYSWSLVLRKVREKLGRKITLLRLDSIVWQVGKIMYACNYNKARSREKIEKYMIEKTDVEKDLANKLAKELTKFIKRVTINF